MTADDNLTLDTQVLPGGEYSGKKLSPEPPSNLIPADYF